MTKYSFSAVSQSAYVQSISDGFIANDVSSLSAFLNKTTSSSFVSAPTGIMPPGVLNINNSIIVYERPPQFQNIQIIPQIVDEIKDETTDIHTYRLPIPWQLYICTYSVYDGRYYPNSVRMFFMNSSLTGSDINTHRVYLPTLPNFYSSALLCNPMFASMEEIERYSNDVAGVIQASYNWVWDTGSNLDLTMPIVEAYYQLPIISESKVPTLFDTIDKRYARAVNGHSNYISFPYVNTLLRTWEQYPLHEISNLVWPNASSQQFLAIHARSLGDYWLSEYFADRQIDLSDSSDYSHSCYEEECSEDCESNGLNYDHEDYLRYVKNRLCNIKTFYDAYDDVLQNLHEITPPMVNRMQHTIQDVYLKSLNLT